MSSVNLSSCTGCRWGFCYRSGICCGTHVRQIIRQAEWTILWCRSPGGPPRLLALGWRHQGGVGSRLWGPLSSQFLLAGGLGIPRKLLVDPGWLLWVPNRPSWCYRCALPLGGIWLPLLVLLMRYLWRCWCWSSYFRVCLLLGIVQKVKHGLLYVTVDGLGQVLKSMSEVFREFQPIWVRDLGHCRGLEYLQQFLLTVFAGVELFIWGFGSYNSTSGAPRAGRHRRAPRSDGGGCGSRRRLCSLFFWPHALTGCGVTPEALCQRYKRSQCRRSMIKQEKST